MKSFSIARPNGYAALITTIGLGALMMLTMTSIVLISISDLHIAQNSIQGIRAFHIAEAGVEHLFSNWLVEPVPETGTVLDNVPLLASDGSTFGTYTVTVEALGDAQYRIQSKGRSRNAVRKIETEVRVGIGGVNAGFEKAFMSNSPASFPSNMNIWGDVYLREGFLNPWANGRLYATDALGTRFATLVPINEAPYGTLEYYYSSDDTWKITPAPQTTTEGDAHGYWMSSQTIPRTTTWLDPIHNTGDPDHPNSGTYFNRNAGGDYPDPTAISIFGNQTGIAVRNDAISQRFPDIDNGLYADFVAYYDVLMPKSNLRENLTIVDHTLGGELRLANGKNDAIVGSQTNPNGYATQLIWTGTAIRDDGTVYTGPLTFPETNVVYVDGPIMIQADIQMDALTFISSDQTTIRDIAQFPTQHFDLLAFGDIIIEIDQPLAGVLFSSGTLFYRSPASFSGSIVVQQAEFQQGIDLVFKRDFPFAIQTYLPGGSQHILNVLRWKEIAP